MSGPTHSGRMLGRHVIATFAVLALAAPALALEPVGTTLPWNTLDCNFVYANVRVPTASLADHTPPGWFTYSSSTLRGNPVTDLVFEADSCAEGSGLSGQIAPMDYASTWIPTIPSIRYAIPNVFTVLAYDVLIPDEARRDVLAADGASVHDGAVTFSVDLRDGKPLTPFTVDTVLDGVGTIHFDIIPLATLPTAGGGEFAQYTPGDDTFTYWRTNWQATQSNVGVGVVTLPPDSWQAKAIGTNVITANFNFGTWDYFDGKIVLNG